MNPFSFCLLEMPFIFTSVLNDRLSWKSILGCRVFIFPFSGLNILCYSLLTCRSPSEKLAYNRLMWVSSNEILCFPIAAFKILFWSLTFAILTMICRRVFCFGFTLFETLCNSQTWIAVSFKCLAKISLVHLLHFLFFPAGSTRTWMLISLMLSQRYIKLPIFFFNLLFFFAILIEWFPLFYHPYHLSILLYH